MNQAAAEARSLGPDIRNLQVDTRSDLPFHGKRPVLEVRRAAVAALYHANIDPVRRGRSQAGRLAEILREAAVPIKSWRHAGILSLESGGLNEPPTGAKRVAQSRVGVAQSVI